MNVGVVGLMKGKIGKSFYCITYIFGILTSRAIDWYIHESILRGSKEGGCSTPKFYHFGSLQGRFYKK